MNKSTAQLIDYINSGNAIENFEVSKGTGVLFSNDTWEMYKDGNEHLPASASKFSFSDIKSESLRQAAKCYVLEDYCFQRSSPNTIKGTLFRCKKFFNFLHSINVDKMSEVNEFIFNEYIQFLKQHIQENNLSQSLVQNHFQAINRLTKGCNFCEDKLNDKFYTKTKKANSLAIKFSKAAPQKTKTIPHSVARKIINSATRILDDVLLRCVEDSRNIEQVKMRSPERWRTYLGTPSLRKRCNFPNPFVHHGSKGNFDKAMLKVRTALQIYILFYTGMRANELTNLPINCCSFDSEGNVCEIKSGIIKGKGPSQKRGLYVWYAPPQLKGYLEKYLEVFHNFEIAIEHVSVNLCRQYQAKRAACTGSLRKRVIKYCEENDLLETRKGDQWEIKLHQFRTHYVRFMTQNHMNFSAVSEQMKHRILDTTFGYSGSLEGSLTRVVDPSLIRELSTSKATIDWKEAEKSLCCETATNTPEESSLAHYRAKFKATVDPKERDKVIEEYLAVGHDPCRMPVGVCVANHNVRHKCGMQNNLLGCKTSCPNFTCEVHDYGRIVYEKSVEFRRLENDSNQPSIKRSIYGKFADQFDALMKQWENAECREA